MQGLAGNDLLEGRNGDDAIFGGLGNDTLRGEAGNDRLYGDAGFDLMSGGDGNDVLFGGDSRDRLWGDAGDDTLSGQAGNDDLYGGLGDDLIYGGDGNDRIEPGYGQNTIHGGAGDDYVSMPFSATDGDGPGVFSAAMLFFGGSGNDSGFGGYGADNMRGELGNDTLYGGWGDDRLDGGSGDDRLFGSAGADRLIGGDGDDVLRSGQGAEDRSILTGGSGNDAFLYNFQPGVVDRPDNPEPEMTFVNDLITDFSAGDKLQISSRNDPDFEPLETYTFSFADLDTNGNGIITDADDAVSIGLASFMGEQRFSLTIDVAKFAALQEPSPGSFSGTITLYGVTTLTAGDFA